MSYLAEFRALAESDSKARFLRLWEEYCLSDVVDGQELAEILAIIKDSPVAPIFGEYAETAVPLWQQVSHEKLNHEILRLLLDLETTNSPLFADLATSYLEKKYGSHRHYNEFMRLSGLRFRENFQGVITRFELLCHLEKGNFVFHSGGWGVGEILDVSLISQHATVEFEGTRAPKEISFDNAFKSLQPLPSSHFLARRFGDPDTLEKEGKENPVMLIQLLLQDLGPKTASEIKDELSDLVIPEKDWTKWWQLARSKIKKNTLIKSPESSKERFELRRQELAHSDRFFEALKGVERTEEVIQMVYQYLRDFSEVFKDAKSKEAAKEALKPALEAKEDSSIEKAMKLEALFLLAEILPEEFAQKADKYLLAIEQPDEVLKAISVTAVKKQALVVIRQKSKKWESHFLSILFVMSPSQIRDYIFKELSANEKVKPLLEERIRTLLNQVTLFPEAFFWYFLKLAANESVPLSDKEHKTQFLEAFFILLHYLEDKNDYRDLVKKMNHLLSEKRYALFRSIIENTPVEYLKELLLLASKCHSLSKQDLRILQSLAQVVQPEMGEKEREKREEVIWTTAEGYRRIQERIHHIGTVETVDNAREIEAARALGDLRENSEYKFALERRSRLQSELKMLSRQLNQARILTKEDITTREVSVGVVVDLIDSKGKKVSYTLLGPWDADPDKRILSFQSKLAQAMLGKKKGDMVDFQGGRYTVAAIKSFL